MSHRPAELRSIALHRAVAERLRADPSLVDRALARVARWRATGEVSPFYAARWERILSSSLEDLEAFLVADSEEARDLRQCSPFAGVLDSRTRWTLLRELGR